MSVILRFLTLSALLICGAAQAKDMTVLRLGIFAPERHVHVREVVLPWVENVNRRLARHDVRIAAFTGGALGRKGDMQLRLLESGVHDLTWFPTGYLPGRFPETELFEIPLLTDDPELLTRAFWRLYEEGSLEGLENYKPLAISVSPPYHFHLTFPVDSLDDLAGRKIRVLNAAQAEMMQSLGATPVAGIGGSEVAESLSRGLIDGAMFSWHATRSMGVERITTMHIDQAIAFSPSILIMRRKSYDALPAPARRIIDETTGEEMSLAYIRTMLGEVEKALARVGGNDRHSFYTPTAEERARLQATFAALTDRWAGDDTARLKLVRDLKRVLADIAGDTAQGGAAGAD